MGEIKLCQLPLKDGAIDYISILPEVIEAASKLQIYREKMHDSRLSYKAILPAFQQKDAIASIEIAEGNHVPEEMMINMASGYYEATLIGFKEVAETGFSTTLFQRMYTSLVGNQTGMEMRPANVAVAAEDVPEYMENLASYMQFAEDMYHPLVRAAISYMQFLLINPYAKENGKMARILFTLNLYKNNIIGRPSFFISEEIKGEISKQQEYVIEVTKTGDWTEWIRFFLQRIIKQCDTYINKIIEVNRIYDEDLAKACEIAKTSQIFPVINHLYIYPVTTAKKLEEDTKIPKTSVNRFLGALTEAGILRYEEEKRTRTYYYDRLLDCMFD